MRKLKVSLFSLTNLLSLLSHGQFKTEKQEADQNQIIVQHVRATINKLDLPENQCIHLTDDDVIYVFTYLDDNLIGKKDSIQTVARKQSIEIYSAVKEGKVGTKKVFVDGLSICHQYWNRYFMGYGNSMTSVCNIEHGIIKEFQMLPTPVRTTGAINTELYQDLTAFQLKPNQYIVPHLTEKETLCLVNITIGVSEDWKKESGKEFKRFQNAVKAIRPYKKLMVRYESKYTATERKEYTYTFKERKRR